MKKYIHNPSICTQSRRFSQRKQGTRSGEAIEGVCELLGAQSDFRPGSSTFRVARDDDVGREEDRIYPLPGRGAPT